LVKFTNSSPNAQYTGTLCMCESTMDCGSDLLLYIGYNIVVQYGQCSRKRVHQLKKRKKSCFLHFEKNVHIVSQAT